jgi:hypothetical protein
LGAQNSLAEVPQVCASRSRPKLSTCCQFWSKGGWSAWDAGTVPYLPIAIGLALMGLGGGLFFSPNTSAAMNAAPRPRLGIAAGTLATLRQTGMVTSFALALAVAAGSLPQAVMLQLFVGTNVTLGSEMMQAFIVGIQSAFWVSAALCLVAAGFSLVRGKEDRHLAAIGHMPAG